MIPRQKSKYQNCGVLPGCVLCDHVIDLTLEKRARNSANLPSLPVSGSAACVGAVAGVVSAATATLRRNIFRSLSRFLAGSAGAPAGAASGMGEAADAFLSPVKTKAANPARTVHTSTKLASIEGVGGARALARAENSTTPAVRPSRGVKSTSAADCGFRGGGERTDLGGTTVCCPLPSHTTVPGRGFLA